MDKHERKSALLIIKESAAIIEGYAGYLEAHGGDIRALTVANLSRDYVKKLAWVHQIISRDETQQ